MRRIKILEAEWSPKNPKPFSESESRYKAFWEHICKCGQKHEWKARIMERKNGSGCSSCTGQGTGAIICPCKSLAKIDPKLSLEWHPTKNILTPQQVAPYSNRIAWWKCLNSKCQHHEWRTAVCNRYQGKGCPYCANNKICPCNSLLKLRPELALEWHPDKNKINPSEVSLYSNQKAWWKCRKSVCDHHEWEAVISTRSRGGGCPFCLNRKICPCNSLAEIRPDLLKEWHPTKNEVSPYEIPVGSCLKAWWVCEKKHEWEAIVYSRNKGNGCPICKHSRGEKKIKKLLEELKIRYVSQKRISYKEFSRLFFDFYLPDHNVAIEFDGIQHFEPIEFFGGQKQLEKQKLYDSYKNAHCEENGISLVRIHYKDAEEIPALVDLAAEERDRPWSIRSMHYP